MSKISNLSPSEVFLPAAYAPKPAFGRCSAPDPAEGPSRLGGETPSPHTLPPRRLWRQKVSRSIASVLRPFRKNSWLRLCRL